MQAIMQNEDSVWREEQAYTNNGYGTSMQSKIVHALHKLQFFIALLKFSFCIKMIVFPNLTIKKFANELGKEGR